MRLVDSNAYPHYTKQPGVVQMRLQSSLFQPRSCIILRSGYELNHVGDSCFKILYKQNHGEMISSEWRYREKGEREVVEIGKRRCHT